MAQHVVVKDYCLEWKIKYQEEKEKLIPILKENYLAIYHIGSTSILGLAAKPIIDIMIVVRSLIEVDNIKEKFIELGYEYLGEFGIKGRRYLRKGGDNRTHQIHIFQVEDKENIIRHLAFKNYLESHAEKRDEYAKLKKELAIKYPYDIEKYCIGKDSFIKECERKALKEYDSSWDNLYLSARKVQYQRIISSSIEAGSVSAALLTENNNIYVGVCIDTACSLGMCAERNAIANMITNGENIIKQVLAINNVGDVIMPCGSCRELMMQLGHSSEEILVLCDYENKKSITLRELLPNWWK